MSYFARKLLLLTNNTGKYTRPASKRVKERGRGGGKQTEMVAIVVFSVFTSVQQCQVESLVEHSASSFWQLLLLLLLLLVLVLLLAGAAALFTTQIAAGFTQAKTNFTFSVCV